MERFKSKIGWEPILLFLVVLMSAFPISSTGTNSIPDTRSYYGNLVFLFISVTFCLDYILRMQYVVDNNLLKIKGGIWHRRQIKIEQIRSISEIKKYGGGRNNMALSSDGLEIKYNNFNQLKTVIISPKEKAAFIDSIKKINAAVEVKLKA